ncbi:ABC transporter permease, partial [Desulfobacteraceae bacterium SEEP-SAG9]
MVNYIIRRILWAIPVLLVISLITFSLGHIIPGGPFDEE